MISLIMTTLLALTARIALQRPARAMASGEESPNPLQEAAEAGDREAMYHLGWAFENGRGLEADPLKAASWYRLAADRGHERAAAGLERVLGAKDFDYALLATEDQEAFDHDLSLAATARLPLMVRVPTYREGDLREVEVMMEAATLLEGVKAMEPERFFQLSILYSTNQIKTRDSTPKARWLRRAAMSGMIPAMTSYAFLLLRDRADKPQDITEAHRLLRKSVAAGFGPAKYGLWMLRQISPGLVPLDEAIAGLRENAEAGNALAQFEYGRLLKEGRDVPRDEALGRSYINRALRNGYSTKGRITLKASTDAKADTPEAGSPKADTPEAGSPKARPPKTRPPKTGSAKTAKGSTRKKREDSPIPSSSSRGPSPPPPAAPGPKGAEVFKPSRIKTGRAAAVGGPKPRRPSPRQRPGRRPVITPASGPPGRHPRDLWPTSSRDRLGLAGGRHSMLSGSSRL
jgi:TPR repeat protein